MSKHFKIHHHHSLCELGEGKEKKNSLAFFDPSKRIQPFSERERI